MTDPMTDRAAIGHNSGNPEGLASAIWSERLVQINRRLEGVRLPLNEHTASTMRDVLADATSALKDSDAERREIQKPHEDRLTAIRNAFRSVTAQGETIRDKCRQHLGAFMETQRIEQERIANEARATALLKAQEAEEARKAEMGDIDAFSPAGDALKAAAEAEIHAEYLERQAAAGPRIASGSGVAKAASFRTSWGVTVTDHRKLVKAFQDHPDMIECATKLAAAQVRAAKGDLRKPIPGCEPVERKTVV